MTKSVLFALAAIAMTMQTQIAAASDQHPACGLTCFTTKAADEKQCSAVPADQRRDCMEQASLKYRNCTTTCASSRVGKSSPAPHLIKSNATEIDKILAQ